MKIILALVVFVTALGTFAGLKVMSMKHGYPNKFQHQSHQNRQCNMKDGKNQDHQQHFNHHTNGTQKPVVLDTINKVK